MTAVLPKVLGKGPEAVQLAALDAIGNLQLREAAPNLVATVASQDTPEAVRVGALKALDTFGSDAVTRGIDSAEKSSDAALRLAALQIAARRSPDRALPIIRRFVAGGSEAEQQAAFQALGQLKGAEAPLMIVAAIDQLAAGKILPGAQMELIDTAEKSEAPAVKARWAKQQAAWKASGDALAPYSFALDGGNPRRGGGEFFQNSVLPCARCHKVNGEGGEAGPDLTTIAKDKSKEYLLESIIKPSAHIAQGFDIVTFTLKNGEPPKPARSRVRRPAQIVLKRADNTTVNIDPKQVQQRVTAPSSMPDDLRADHDARAVARRRRVPADTHEAAEHEW